jgi:hypothetical protein
MRLEKPRKKSTGGMHTDAGNMKVATMEEKNADACKTIAEAVNLGDRYRELVSDAHERWKNHEINNSQLYEIQCEAHRRVYGN